MLRSMQKTHNHTNGQTITRPIENMTTDTSGSPARAAPLLVPIRSLGENHRLRIARHLLSLCAQDRYLRFGYSAKDAHIEQYVAGLDFDRDEIFGIYNRRLALIAMAHLAYMPPNLNDTGAEFGVSVLPPARGKGFGARLFERAALHATNSGIDHMFIHALSENAAMLKIATNAGARIQRHGAESEAFLQLPALSLESRLTEYVEERVAKSDYRIKVTMKRLLR